jgi:hypothetical protein
MVFFLQRNGYLKNTIGQAHIYDMGAWMFAFTVFYAYIAFSQFLLIYYANIPEETIWFYHRLEGSWKYITYGLLIFRFCTPVLDSTEPRTKAPPKHFGLRKCTRSNYALFRNLLDRHAYAKCTWYPL